MINEKKEERERKKWERKKMFNSETTYSIVNARDKATRNRLIISRSWAVKWNNSTAEAVRMNRKLISNELNSTGTRRVAGASTKY